MKFSTEKTEEEIFSEAVSMPFSRKVDCAVGLMKTFCTPDSVLCFSGGKDSIVIKDLMKRSGIGCQNVYSQTTIDPPELIYYIRDYHKDVFWKRPTKPLLVRLVDRPNGPPTRKSRWCCEEYKENTGNGHVKIIGVRALESVRRKGLWKQVNANRRGGTITAPIVYWSDADIWQYIHENRLPYCCLYDEGFKRLGCVGCPLAGAKMQKKEFARWPGFERIWKRSITRFWNKWHGVPKRDGGTRYFEVFGSPEGLWNWWISGKAYKPDDATVIQQSLDLFSETGDTCEDVDCQNRFMTV